MGYIRPKILCLTLLLVSFLYNKKSLWSITIWKTVMALWRPPKAWKFSHKFILWCMILTPWEKSSFFSFQRTTKISFIFRLFVQIYVALVKNFQNCLKYISTPKIWKVMKFYNVDNRSFETDFNSIWYVSTHMTYSSNMVTVFKC